MEGAVFTVLISSTLSALAALGAVTLTHYFGRKRDHEADWRKIKLEHYKEYLFSLSRVVGSDSNAANSLTLVAPPSLLIALYTFQEEIGQANRCHDPAKALSLPNSLMRNMREGCHSETPKDTEGLVCRILDITSEQGAQGDR